MAYGEGFEGAEVLRVPAQQSFCKICGKNDQKFWANERRGSDPHIPPPWLRPCSIEIKTQLDRDGWDSWLFNLA